MSGAISVDSISTRIGASVSFRTWCAPSLTARERRRRRPRAAAPRRPASAAWARRGTTISHSSFAWCVWYGQSRSPGSSSYMLPPISSASMRAPTQASLLRQPGRSSTRSHSSPWRLKTFTGADARPRDRAVRSRSPYAPRRHVLLAVRKPAEHPARQHLLETAVEDPARQTCVESPRNAPGRLPSSITRWMIANASPTSSTRPWSWGLRATSRTITVTRAGSLRHLRSRIFAMPSSFSGRGLVGGLDRTEASDELAPVLDEDRS